MFHMMQIFIIFVAEDVTAITDTVATHSADSKVNSMELEDSKNKDVTFS